MKEILFALVLFIANVIQALTGFAGGPISMPPCIALVGINDAKAAITFIFLVSTAVISIINIKNIKVKNLAIMIAFMLIGMIPGMWVFEVLEPKILMIIYGVIVVLIGIWKLLSKGNTDLKKPWNYIALIVAGIMQGMFTSGGPFLVLYATSDIPDKKEFRATVSSIWAILNIYMCARMYNNGMYTPYTWKLVLYSAIPVAIGIVLGNIWGKKIKQQTFLKVVYCLLIISGSLLIVNYFTS